MKCNICGGRTIKTEKGRRCLKSTCEGANEEKQQEAVTCKCGEEMTYTGLTQLGEPLYKCLACGATTKL